MQWNLEGMYIEGMYMSEFPVSGRVELSRVAYGGTIKHTVVLAQPIVVYGAIRTRVILENECVTRVSDNVDEAYSPFETVNS